VPSSMALGAPARLSPLLTRRYRRCPEGMNRFSPLARYDNFPFSARRRRVA
jgi:hypothetical protein